MKATYTKAIVWTIDAECLSPLRTGGADGDAETVLHSHDGRAMIQGSSISGCLRGWLERSDYREHTDSLFGTQERSGCLRFSDALFSPNTRITVRPRLRIDGTSGTAEDGKKFDLAHVETGSHFTFTVSMLGSDPAADAEALEAALGALNSGEITLGAQKTNGFGRVRLSVGKRCFDLSKQPDRDAWLNDETEGEPITLPTMADSSKVVFTVSGTLGSLLVKSSQPKSDGDRTYTENIREAGKAVLPGSSVKGALRARAEMITEHMGFPPQFIETIFGTDADAEQKRPGEVTCFDAYPSEQGTKISRIRINKLTGGVMRGALFTEEPVSGDITLKISVENSCPQGCALVLYALRDLGLGLWNLGSGGSVGRGYLKVRELTSQTPHGQKLTLRFDEDTCTSEDPDKLAETWIRALREATI